MPELVLSYNHLILAREQGYSNKKNKTQTQKPYSSRPHSSVPATILETTPILNFSPNADMHTPRSQHSDIIMQDTTTSMHKPKPQRTVPLHSTDTRRTTLPIPCRKSLTAHAEKKKPQMFFLTSVAYISHLHICTVKNVRNIYLRK
jgi:hypothetical protein